jgi:hypothetical protein
MKSNKKIITVTIVVGLLLLGGVVVYMKDSQTVSQSKHSQKVQQTKDSVTVQEAKIVRAYVVNFCMEYARYPSKEEFDKRYPKLAADPDWSYRPGKDMKSGTLQYPPPLFSASGDNGTVSNPCQVFNTEVF